MSNKTPSDFQQWLTIARESLYKLSIPQFSRFIKEQVITAKEQETAAEENEKDKKTLDRSFDRYQRSLETSASPSTTIRVDWMRELIRIMGVDFGAEKRFILQAQSVADALWNKSHDFTLRTFDENFQALLDDGSTTPDIDKGLIRLLPHYEVKAYMEIATSLPMVAYHSRNYFVALAYLFYKDNIIGRYDGKISGAEFLLGSVVELLDKSFKLLDRLIGKSQEYKTLLNQYNTIKQTIWGNDDPLPQPWARAASREENQRIIWAQQEFKMNRRLAVILTEIGSPCASMATTLAEKIDQLPANELLENAPQINQFVTVIYSNVQTILSIISEACNKNQQSLAQGELPMPMDYTAAVSAMAMVRELCHMFSL